MSAYPKPYSSRISGGVVVLSPNEPPNGWEDVEAFNKDVLRSKRVADAAPAMYELLQSLNLRMNDGRNSVGRPTLESWAEEIDDLLTTVEGE